MNPIPPIRRRRALAALLALGPVAACAELRRPNMSWPVPSGLLPAGSEPGRTAIAAVTGDLQGANTGLRGDPARVARAAALLEWLAVELNAGQRWAPVPANVKTGIGQARDEMRAALGLDPLAASPLAASALAAAARALRGGNRAAAAAALPASLFPRGGEAALARLEDPGPLPQGEIATGALSDAVRALDETNGWAAEFDTPVPPDRGGLGPQPFGI